MRRKKTRNIEMMKHRGYDHIKMQASALKFSTVSPAPKTHLAVCPGKNTVLSHVPDGLAG